MKTAATRLTAEEAEKLWRAWTSNGDSRARDQLVLSYTPMVTYIASRKARELPAHWELDDLVSCGLVALIESVDRFDPRQGATFEQYAWTRVSGAIMDELRRQDWAPRALRRLGRRIDRAQDELYVKNGTTPDADQLGKVLGLPADQIATARDELGRAEVVSLNAPARGLDDVLSVEIGDTIESGDREGSPELSALASERVAKLREAIAALDERERRVLALIHVHELSGAEVGRMLGVTESRVSQIMSAIRSKLRASLTAYEATSELVA